MKSTFKQFTILCTLMFTTTFGFGQTQFIQHWMPYQLENGAVASYQINYEPKESYDYFLKVAFEQQDEILAEIIGIQTTKNAYRDSYNLNKRCDQTELIEIENINVKAFNIPMVTYKNPNGDDNFTVQLTLIQKDQNKMDIYTDWIDTEIQSNYRILSYYINSNSKSVAEEIIEKMVSKLENETNLSESGGQSIPIVYASKANYKMGTIDLEIQNVTEEEQVMQFIINYASSENQEKESFQFDLYLEPGLNDLQLNDFPLSEAEIFLQKENKIIDQFRMIDGQWKIINQDDAFLFVSHPESRYDEEDHLEIERDIVAVARLYNEIIIERNLNPNGYSKDLSTYDQLSFTAEGIDQISFQLMNENLELLSETKTIESEKADHTISFDCSECDEVTHIKIQLKSNTLAQAMQLYKLKFSKEKLLSIIENSETMAFQIIPNPSTDYIKFNLKKEHNPNSVIAVYDFSGRLFYQKYAGNDQNQLIDVSNLPEGNYHLMINDNESSVHESFVVTH